MSTSTKKVLSAALSATTAVWMSGAMLLVPVAHAQSTTDLQAMINSLLAQIQVLQSQLAAQGGGSTTTSVVVPPAPLTVGAQNSDVMDLQKILISEGFLKISAPTNYFGSLTKAALAAWQAANNVSPAVGYYGPITRSAMVAKFASGTPTVPGQTTPTGPTAPASGLVVSLASDNPSAGSLISSSNSAAGRVPVLAVNLTAGNASGLTVNEVKFTKQGVLSDSSIAGAYLVENGKVLAQYSSLNQGVLSFSNLNLNVAAGQTRKVWLAIDPAQNLSAGNTVSFALASASHVSAVDATNNVVTPTGNFPLNGNIFTVTSVSSPAIATFALASSTVGNTVYAGTQGVNVSQWTLTTGNSAVYLKSINFKVIGSANKSDIRNVKLLLNGVQVGETLPQVAADGSAYFDLSNSSQMVKINTGSANLQIQADVMGSPSFNFAFQLLNSYDVYVVDSQYNVPVIASVTGGSGTTVTINQGQITLSSASDTPTGNIAKGGSATNLAKFTLYAAGEAIKVKYLTFSLTFTGASAGLNSQIRNVALVDDAGGQIGSTITDLTTSKTCSDTSYANSTSTAVNCFGDSSSQINYIVPANTTRVLTLRGDIQSTADFSTIVARLTGNSSNIQGMTSSQTGSTGQAVGGALTLVSNSLTVAANSAVGTQTVAAGQTNAKIGSYSLTASAAEGVNLNNLSITMSASGTLFSNLKLMVGNTQFGTTQPTLSASGVYTFSGNLNIPAGQTKTVDVHADVLSGIGDGTTYTDVTTLSGCTGQGATTFTSVTCTGSNAPAGQDVKGASQATVQVSLDSASPSAGQLVMGATGNTLATFRFTETSNVENVKINQLNVFQQVAATSSVKSAFSNLSLYQGSTLLGTAGAALTAASTSNPGAGYYYKFNLSNPIIVPMSGSVSVTLKGDVASFSSSGATDNSTHVFKIATSTDSDNDSLSETVVAFGNTSNATSAISLSSPTANAQTVLRSKLSLSSTLYGGSQTSRTRSAIDDLAKVTFAADQAGAVVVNTVTITISGGANSSTLPASISLIDDSTGSTWGSASITATSTTSVTFSGIAFTISAGDSKVVRVRVNSNNTSNTTQQTDSLSLTINAGTDVAYTTAVSGGSSGVSLPTNFAPYNLVTVSYE